VAIDEAAVPANAAGADERGCLKVEKGALADGRGGGALSIGL